MSQSKRRSMRSSKGALGSTLCSAILIGSIGFCCFGYDIAHVASVQGELRNAADAAALAGGKSLFNKPKEAQSVALTIASKNFADGASVSNKNKGVKVIVDVQSPPYLLDLNLPLGLSLNLTNPFNNPAGTVSVTATKEVQHLFGKLYGHHSDTISVTSTASMKRPIIQLYGDQLFPMAVWVDATPYKTGVGPLNLTAFRIGDSVNLTMDNPLTGIKGNTAFTSLGQTNNSAYTLSAIDQALGMSSIKPGLVPALSVGDSINSTKNLEIQKTLFTTPRLNALYGQVLILPIVRDSLSLVDSSTIAGFMGYKVTNVVTDAQSGAVIGMTGTLVQPIVSGRSEGADLPKNLLNLKHDDSLLGYAPQGLKLIR